MSDAIAVLTWWILVQIFGLVALPLSYKLLQRLPDRGYGVSKALGLLLTSYIFWLLGVLGFLQNDTGSVLFSLVVVASISLLYYSHRPNTTESQTPLLPWLRANWKLVLTTELVFAFTFVGWALYRAYVPRIMTAGGEKFMELAFLNSLQRSETLPPPDPWLSGFAISYYYFGYLMMSILIRLSGVAPAVGFNIGGALLFALTATGTFSLVYNLVARGKWASLSATLQGLESGQVASEQVASDDNLLPAIRPPAWQSGEQNRRGSILRPILIALLGVVFVVLLSNYEAPLEVVHWKGVIRSEGFWNWLDIADLDRAPPHQPTSGYTRSGPGWWWWRASRVIFDYDLQNWSRRFDQADPAPVRRENISEFPFFSFLLGDMHPHVLVLPFALLALTASLVLFQIGSEGRKATRGELTLFLLIFGATGFLNAWNLPFLWIVAIAAYAVGRRTTQATHLPIYHPTHLRPILTFTITLAIGSLSLYAPFYIGFQSQASGVLAHVHSSTRLVQFGVMFGPLLFILIAFLAWAVERARRRGALAPRAGLWTSAISLLLALTALVITALVIARPSELRDLAAPGLASETPGGIVSRYLSMRLSTPWVTVLLVGMIGVVVALLWPSLRADPEGGGSSRSRLDWDVKFSLILVFTGALLTLAPEYVYIKDVFGVRLNTIFKFYHLAWVLWGIAAAIAVDAMFFGQDRLSPTARWLLGSGLALVIGLGLLFPLLTIRDRVKEFPEAPTLDGTVYFATAEPADYAAVQWLNTYVEGVSVILETYTRGGYRYEGRVSAQTGLATLVGWGGHEWQWRGSTTEQDKRYPVVDDLYSITDIDRTLTLLNEYDITYVYVGPLERAKWPADGLQKFDQMMDIVYDRDGVTIYKKRETPGGRVGE